MQTLTTSMSRFFQAALHPKIVLTSGLSSRYTPSNSFVSLSCRLLHSQTSFVYNLDDLLMNSQKNGQLLLDRWRPKRLNIVDRSPSLQKLYQNINSKPSEERKWISTITGSPGSGKTLFTALAVNKIKPNVVKSDGDVLDLNNKAEEVNYLPVYITFNDVTPLSPENEGTKPKDLFRNRILFWLFSEFKEYTYDHFLETVIQKQEVPSLDILALNLQSLKIKVVYFIDELKKLELIPGVDPAEYLTRFVNGVKYDISDSHIFASSLVRHDFTKFTTKSQRPISTIPVELITSFDAMLAPAYQSDLALGRFLKSERNRKMFKIFMWGCLGQPRLLADIVGIIFDDRSCFENQTAFQVYANLKSHVESKYKEIVTTLIDPKMIAGAFAQQTYGKMEEVMDNLIMQNNSVSYMKDEKDELIPFISPFLMEYLLVKRSFQGSTVLENTCISYVKDVIKYLSNWTAQSIESQEIHGYSFEGFVPLWLRAYLTCVLVCKSGNRFLKVDELFKSQLVHSECLSSSDFQIELQPQYKIIKHGSYPFIRPDHFAKVESSSEVEMVRFVVKKKSKEQKIFDDGQLIVICKDSNAGCDFFLKFKLSDGTYVYWFIELKYSIMKAETIKSNTLQEAERKHLLVKNQLGKFKDIDKCALVFFTHKFFGATEEEIRVAKIPLIVFSRANIMKLIGPSLGFIAPLHGTPDHFVPQEYFIK